MPDTLDGDGSPFVTAFIVKRTPNAQDLIIPPISAGGSTDYGRGRGGWTPGVAPMSTGGTGSNDFPTTPGAFQRRVKLNSPSFASQAAFIIKINNIGAVVTA